MKTKWYFGVLMAMLAFFAVKQQDMAVPNQEIALQFANTNVSASQIQNAITRIEKQLQGIGIVNTKVVEEAQGTLRISYYSVIDVERIKKILTNTHHRDYETLTPFPFNNKQNHYKLEVYEILKGIDLGSGFKGKYVIDVKLEIDRFSNPELTHYVAIIDSKWRDQRVKTAQKVNTTVAIAIDNTSYKIPEARAGPLS